jgi:putative membrane protein
MKPTPYLAIAGLVGALMLPTSAIAHAASPTRAIPAHSSFALSHADSGTDAVAAISKQDRMFLMTVHQGNLAEIKAGRLALQKGRCEAVKRIAHVFIKDHSRIDHDVQSLADKFDVRLPNAPGAEARKLLAELAALSGHEFDIAWLRLQAAGLREAIKLGKQQLRHGRSPEVKALATAAVPVVMRHLKLLNEAKRRC